MAERCEPPPPLYSDSMRLGVARAAFFGANDFGGDGGYSARWVKLKSKPWPIYFPNSKGRVRSVRLHDLHHIATGYRTAWVGECEIAAWEIASSCADHYHAWALNGGGLALGLLMCPRRVYRAFVRGRHTRNLYREEYSEAMLDQTVGELRERLRLDEAAPRATVRDRAWFGVWAVVGAVLLLAPVVLGAGAVFLILRLQTG